MISPIMLWCITTTFLLAMTNAFVVAQNVMRLELCSDLDQLLVIFPKDGISANSTALLEEQYAAMTSTGHARKSVRGSTHSDCLESDTEQSEGQALSEPLEDSELSYPPIEGNLQMGMNSNRLRPTFEVESLKVFYLDKNVPGPIARCPALAKNATVRVSEISEFTLDIHDIVSQFYNSEYYTEFGQVFEEASIEQQLADMTTNLYWNVSDSSAVFLEQYDLNYVVFRLTYFSKGPERSNTLHLLYAKVYDDQWTELTNVDLIVPCLETDRTCDSTEQSFISIHYPSIVTLPIYVNSQMGRGKELGPSSVNLMLIRNSIGLQEPILTFDMIHRRVGGTDTLSWCEMKVSLDVKRSMFQSFPWRRQVGKANVDEVALMLSTTLADNLDPANTGVYARVTEMRIQSHYPVISEQWTPFLSFKDRQLNHLDEFIYFILRWSDLQVLRCPITDEKLSICTSEFGMNLDEAHELGSSAFKGSTHFVSVNEIVQKQSQTMEISDIRERLESYRREVWIGLARIGLQDCGCGDTYNRASLVVVVKDKDTRFRLSHVSASTLFGITVNTQSLIHSSQRCIKGSLSSFSVNSIIDWAVLDSSTDSQEMNDRLLATVELEGHILGTIEIKGLLSSIMRMDNPNKRRRGGVFAEVDKDDRYVPGHNNENIDCAIEASISQCAADGKSFPDTRRNFFRYSAERDPLSAMVLKNSV